MKKIEEQKSDIDHLFNLIKEKPDLEIVPMVDSEIVWDDGFSYWLGKWGSARIDEMYISDERVYFRYDDEEELQEKYDESLYLDLYPDQQDLTEEQSEELRKKADELVDHLPWKKVIVVYISTP